MTKLELIISEIHEENFNMLVELLIQRAPDSFYDNCQLCSDEVLNWWLVSERVYGLLKSVGACVFYSPEVNKYFWGKVCGNTFESDPQLLAAANQLNS